MGEVKEQHMPIPHYHYCSALEKDTGYIQADAFLFQDQNYLRSDKYCILLAFQKSAVHVTLDFTNKFALKHTRKRTLIFNNSVTSCTAKANRMTLIQLVSTRNRIFVHIYSALPCFTVSSEIGESDRESGGTLSPSDSYSLFVCALGLVKMWKYIFYFKQQLSGHQGYKVLQANEQELTQFIHSTQIVMIQNGQKTSFHQIT